MYKNFNKDIPTTSAAITSSVLLKYLVIISAISFIENFMKQEFFQLVKVGKCFKSKPGNEASQQFAFLPTTLQTIVAALVCFRLMKLYPVPLIPQK